MEKTRRRSGYWKRWREEKNSLGIEEVEDNKEIVEESKDREVETRERKMKDRRMVTKEMIEKPMK